jgi:hypothetical protein
MTVWARGPAGEAKNDEYDRVQIEIGVDSEDLWLVFNRVVSAVVMTRLEARQLVLEMGEALRKVEVVEEKGE